MKITNFRELEIWKLGKEIFVDTYRVTKEFPKEEVFGITSQMRRAAISIPSNIAEGFNRFHNKDYRRLLFIALGSIAELETQFEIFLDLNFNNSQVLKISLEKLDHESRMIRNLIKKLDYSI